MSLPPGLLILVTHGQYSYTRNLGIFDNLNDLKTMIEQIVLKPGDCFPKPLKIVKYTLVNVRKRDTPGWKIYKGKNFPIAEILNNLQVESLRLYVEWTTNPDDDKTNQEEYDFEWFVLNDKYDEFSYGPGGQKYKEAEAKIQQLSQKSKLTFTV